MDSGGGVRFRRLGFNSISVMQFLSKCVFSFSEMEGNTKA